MENQNKTKKKRFTKLVIILFMVAILFFILGLVDIKVNAAESDTYVSSWWSKVYVDSNGEEQIAKNDWYTYTSSSPLEVFYYQSHDDYVTGEPVAFAIYVVSDSPITASGSTSSFKSTEYVFDDRTINVCMSSSGTSFASPLSGYVEVTTDADNVKRLNSMYSMDEFVDYYESEVNAAESTQNIEFLTTWYDTENDELVERFKYKYIVSCDSDMEVFYIQSHTSATNTENTFVQVYVVSKSQISRDKYTYSNGQYYYDDTYAGIQYTLNGQTFYVRQVADLFTNTGNGSANGYVGLEFNYNGAKELSRWYDNDEFAQAYASDYLDVFVDYGSFEINDDLPIVQNLYFDKIEKKENDSIKNIKTITDYIRFDANSDYKLAIMLCPSIYSTVGDNDYVSKFSLYQYDSWVHMITADVGLKEISCELGQFIIPTNSTDCITSSNYKSYYETLCFELSDTGQLVFKPAMGYRLAYVDLENNMIGPSTYIIPNYYNNFNPDDESYSYFVLYSDGTRASEKVMNLKTWEQENGKTLEDVKETIVEVGDTLKDYVIVDNEVDVKEATNWLYSVVNFIGDTPHLIGVVLPFLPKPILYGLYVTVFLGVIASGIAIVKALLP